MSDFVNPPGNATQNIAYGRSTLSPGNQQFFNYLRQYTGENIEYFLNEVKPASISGGVYMTY